VKKPTNWPLLMSGATSAWLIYDINTATETPRQALAILQYILLATSVGSCLGSIVMHLAKKP
jgi:hypothetical protein